jgi:hypothetical protein
MSKSVHAIHDLPNAWSARRSAALVLLASLICSNALGASTAPKRAPAAAHHRAGVAARPLPVPMVVDSATTRLDSCSHTVRLQRVDGLDLVRFGVQPGWRIESFDTHVSLDAGTFVQLDILVDDAVPDSSGDCGVRGFAIQDSTGAEWAVRPFIQPGLMGFPADYNLDGMLLCNTPKGCAILMPVRFSGQRLSLAPMGASGRYKPLWFRWSALRGKS